MSSRLVRKLDMMNAAKELNDLSSPPSNQLQQLHDDRKGQWAISVNGPWRLCSRFEDGEIMLPKDRRPTHPGEIIRYEYLEPFKMTQQQLTYAIGVTRVRINEIILGKRSVTP